MTPETEHWTHSRRLMAHQVLPLPQHKRQPQLAATAENFRIGGMPSQSYAVTDSCSSTLHFHHSRRNLLQRTASTQYFNKTLDMPQVGNTCHVLSQCYHSHACLIFQLHAAHANQPLWQPQGPSTETDEATAAKPAAGVIRSAALLSPHMHHPIPCPHLLCSQQLAS
jgi:hypothetical protein